MSSTFTYSEQIADHRDCDFNPANEPLFHSPDGEPYFGWELTEDGSGFYTQTSEDVVKSWRNAA